MSKPNLLPLRTNNPRPWLWPLLVMAGVTLPVLWILPVLWGRSVSLGLLTALVALPAIFLLSLVASWMFRWPQLLAYTVTPKGLLVQTHADPVEIPRKQVRSAKAVEFSLPWNPRSRAHFPGYYAGSYALPEHGRVSAYASDNKGTGVLLELDSSEKILLTPQNPDELLKLFGGAR